MENSTQKKNAHTQPQTPILLKQNQKTKNTHTYQLQTHIK